MKNRALFSTKDKSKNLKCRLLQFSLGVLRVTDKRSGALHSTFSLKIILLYFSFIFVLLCIEKKTMKF